jgi:ketosteroid isomerase-like protein
VKLRNSSNGYQWTPLIKLLDLKLHKADFRQEEQEILDFYISWQHYCNHIFNKDPDAGKKWYDVAEVMYHDLMGNGARGDFEEHYDRIGPYLANAHIAYRDLEITATAKDFGYATMVQRYWGVTKDGHDFDFKYRIIGLLTKREGRWLWVHEHISFPVDLKTRLADFECGLNVKSSLYLGDKSWGERPLEEVKLPMGT